MRFIVAATLSIALLGVVSSTRTSPPSMLMESVREEMATSRAELSEYLSTSHPCRIGVEHHGALEDELLRKCMGFDCVCPPEVCPERTFELVDTVRKHEDNTETSSGLEIVRNFRKAYETVTRSKEGRYAFANDQLLRCVPAYHLFKRNRKRHKAGKAAAAMEDATPLNADDLRAFQCFYEATNGPTWHVCGRIHRHKNGSLDPCACSNVLCEVQGDERRIVGLVFKSARLTGHLPDCLSDLTQLRVLDVSTNPLNIDAWPPSLGNLQHLEVLVMPPSPSPMPEGYSQLTSLRSLDLYVYSHRPSDKVYFSYLKPICRLPNLLSLHLVNGFHGPFPECIANLTTLLRLELLGNHLMGSGIPSAWGSLVNLRTFISFQNGRTSCPPDDSSDCRPLYQTSVEYVHDEPFMCRALSLAGPIPDTLRNWKKIEKFWVDANYLSGPIPDWIGTDWSQLRTLDLFNNAFTGSIPESLGQLNQLEQAQLQDNQLTGDIPQSLARLPRLQLLNVALNAQLTGCVAHATETAASEQESEQPEGEEEDEWEWEWWEGEERERLREAHGRLRRVIVFSGSRVSDSLQSAQCAKHNNIEL